MGIPKFFRWLSERYPLINQTIDFENVGPVFDCLYLDMNGIIHNCTHPKDDIKSLTAKTEEEMIILVFKYIDNLVNIVKPQKLLYMAIDGVAPRAKMNQQRSRRFRTAKDAEIAMRELISRGEEVPDKPPFDSNCITPGTEFMTRLSEHLKFYIRKRIQEDVLWRKLQVVFSGHETPGEGEHKIMEYIRHQKAQPNYDPNLCHCMYGLDADLIMLSLVTHEPHFALLREEGILDRNKKKRTGESQQFHLLHISLLREYLDQEFVSLKDRIPFEYNPERVYDDFVLMCFLVGNDFVPTLPGLDIAEGSLNSFFTLYKELLPTLDGYLMENGVPVLTRFEKVFDYLAIQERSSCAIVPSALDEISRDVLESNPEEAGLARVLFSRSGALGLSDEFSEEGETGENIFRTSYYEGKFKKSAHDVEFIAQLKKSYLEAMFWIAHYYYHGCVSWSWYYPYHYAPLALDMTNLSSVKIEFAQGEPFKPLEQLLGVLPAASRSFLPPPFRVLMVDVDSPLQKYYPLEFELDMNGKKNDWEAIVVIPFIDENLLLKATNGAEKDLTDAERKRNSFSPSFSYTYDPKAPLITYPSSMPVHFPPIEQCHSAEQALKLPPFPTGVTHPFVLLPKSNVGLNAPCGIPTFKSIKFTSKLATCGVSIFGNVSRKDSCLLIPTLPQAPEPFQSVVDRYLGKVCWLWPHNRQVLVDNVSNKDAEHRKNVPEPEPFSSEESGWWLKDAEFLQTRYKSSKAIAVDRIDCILSVKPLLGLTMNSRGHVAQRWSNELQKVPLGVLLDVNPTTEDPRFKVVKSVPVETQFPVSSLCIPLRNDCFGSLCEVVSHTTNGGINAKIVEASVYPSWLGKAIKSHNQQYHSTSQCARQLNVSARTLNKITATVSFEPGNYNFGLQLKFSGKNKQLMGYTYRHIDEDGNMGLWEYSNLALDILIQYKKLYPQVWKMIEADPGRETYDSNLLFPDAPMVPIHIVKKQDEAVAATKPEKDKEDDMILDDGEDTLPTNKLKELNISQEIAESLEKEQQATAATGGHHDDEDLGDEIVFQPIHPDPSKAPETSPAPTPEGATPTVVTPKPELGNMTSNPFSIYPATADGKSQDEKKKPKKKKPVVSNNPNMVNSKLIELKRWLQALPTHKLPKVEGGATSLTADCVKELQETMDTWVPTPSKELNVEKEFKRTQLVRPIKAVEVYSGFSEFGPEFSPHFTNFELGDRVVYLRESGPLPFGTRGIVISIKGDFLDILLDKPCLAGISLGGICSDLRGQCVSKGAVLNLTFKKKPPINSWNQPHGVRNQSNQNHQQQHHQQQAQSPTKSSLIPTQVLNKSGGVPREGGQNPLKASGAHGHGNQGQQHANQSSGGNKHHGNQQHQGGFPSQAQGGLNFSGGFPNATGGLNSLSQPFQFNQNSLSLSGGYPNIPQGLNWSGGYPNVPPGGFPPQPFQFNQNSLSHSGGYPNVPQGLDWSGGYPNIPPQFNQPNLSMSGGYPQTQTAPAAHPGPHAQPQQIQGGGKRKNKKGGQGQGQQAVSPQGGHAHTGPVIPPMSPETALSLGLQNLNFEELEPPKPTKGSGRGRNRGGGRGRGGDQQGRGDHHGGGGRGGDQQGRCHQILPLEMLLIGNNENY